MCGRSTQDRPRKGAVLAFYGGLFKARHLSRSSIILLNRCSWSTT